MLLKRLLNTLNPQALKCFTEELHDSWLIIALQDDSGISKPFHVLNQRVDSKAFLIRPLLGTT